MVEENEDFWMKSAHEHQTVNHKRWRFKTNDCLTIFACFESRGMPTVGETATLFPVFRDMFCFPQNYVRPSRCERWVRQTSWRWRNVSQKKFHQCLRIPKLQAAQQNRFPATRYTGKKTRYTTQYFKWASGILLVEELFDNQSIELLPSDGFLAPFFLLGPP